MNAFAELILAAHRAIWLPVYLALGLEAEPITLPVQFAQRWLPPPDRCRLSGAENARHGGDSSQPH